ncbi:MAG: UDP-2,4-diacetamido-2,4,6-trideoxy-beta-L-altropyranose hydrolase [Rhodobacteraceae bacterium]|nr:UDP-2,4-diacetamido-2,4,6-trideoxy-beta-L-altropyranose hydrolase [Paracoccaceae bacterium]
MGAGAKIMFRADASLKIGTGHVMRCLTLARALADQGAECLFVCRAHQGNLNDYIRRQGFAVIALPLVPGGSGWLGCDWQTDAEQCLAAIEKTNFNWLIVDHYGLGENWETAMWPVCDRLMVIDDLANRPHDCDLLLDQNLGRKAGDYQPHVGDQCRVLLGPDFALLRPEFAEMRRDSLKRRGASQSLKTLLITMGGVDQHNVTGKILQALKDSALPVDARIQVVMGPHAPWLPEVKTLAKTMPWPTDVLVGVSNMAQLMAQSDLAIGAAGSTSWERCCLGLPTLALVLADNQREAAQFLEGAGAIILLGNAQGAGWQARLTEVLATLSKDMLGMISDNARVIVDGSGVKRCLQEMQV